MVHLILPVFDAFQLFLSQRLRSNQTPVQARQPASHLGTLAGAVAIHAARASILGPWRLPGPLLGGAVVVEVSAIGVLVGLPVAQDMERGAGGDGRRCRLSDLQLLEVGVDGRLGAAVA